MSTSNPYETPNVTPAVSSVAAVRTVTLKRLDVVSVGMMLGIFYAILGLLIGGMFSLLALVGVAAQGGDAMAGLVTGFGAIIFMPLFYGVGGFIGGIIAAWLYNGCAALAGGIKFDLE